MSEARPEAEPTLLIDNERARVTEWRFAPGAATTWHRHEMDYVVLPMKSGTLRSESADGTVDAELEAGKPYYREAGAEHNAINANHYEILFIEIELK
jgi:quercetin dioxygenase-like cupin family protein